MHAPAGYGSNALRTDKDNEYAVFARVTHLLRQAQGAGKAPDAIRAVHKNSELWTLLAADLAHPGNALPDQVKSGLLSLAIFSIRHGRAVMQGEATVDALIDVNISMMKGLRTEAAA